MLHKKQQRSISTRHWKSKEAKMTVAELIKELKALENQDADVYDENGYEITTVEVDDAGDVCVMTDPD
jgi:hypothetical protein